MTAGLLAPPPPAKPAYTRPEAAELEHLCGNIHHALQQLRTVPYRQLAAIHVETARLLLQRIGEIACPDPDSTEETDDVLT